MALKTVNALVITGFGVNCEEEMAAAYRLAGANVRIVHLNDILIEGVSIHDYDIINFPGGFSFGDDISSGKVLANKIMYKKLPTGNTFLEDIQRFLDDGKYIFGVCNGFQALVKLGLLPNIAGRREQEVTLMGNDSGQYEDRWCYYKVTPNSPSPFLHGGEVLYFPVRHGEGKLIIKNDELRQQMLDHALNCLSYCDAAGNVTDEYPLNPNGAELNCAALTDKTGHVLGMMPHPEAFLSLYNHPNWGQIKRQNPNISEEGQGLQLFKNIVNHIINISKRMEE